MATIKCPHCRRTVDAQSLSCPYCHYSYAEFRVPIGDARITPRLRPRPQRMTFVVSGAAAFAVCCAVALSLVALFGGQSDSGDSTASASVENSQLPASGGQAALTSPPLPHVANRPLSPPPADGNGPPIPGGLPLAAAGQSVADPASIFERAAPAVVRIEMKQADGESCGLGSGFFVDDQGTLVTNAHVVSADGAGFAVVRLLDDTQFIVDEVQAINDEMDLAILKVTSAPRPHVKLSLSRPKVGERVFAVGNPLGLRHTFSEGLVSGLRPYDAKHAIIQTTAAISPGSSGGPLLDTDGNVIGVTTVQMTMGQNLNFAMPASAVHELLEAPTRPVKIAAIAAEPSSANGGPPAASLPEPRVLYAGMTDTLIGIDAVTVVVEGLHASSRLAGLSESAIEGHVERSLRLAGVSVLSHSEWQDHPRRPYLYVNVATIASPDLSVYGYIVSVELNQQVLLPARSTDVEIRTMATTWKDPATYGSVGRLRLVQAVERAVNESTARFVKDLRLANP